MLCHHLERILHPSVNMWVSWREMKKRPSFSALSLTHTNKERNRDKNLNENQNCYTPQQDYGKKKKKLTAELSCVETNNLFFSFSQLLNNWRKRFSKGLAFFFHFLFWLKGKMEEARWIYRTLNFVLIQSALH